MATVSKPKYPWNKWFSRRQFRLRRGKDFRCQVHGMVAQIRKAAKLHRYRPSIQVDKDTITVTEQ